MRELDEDTDLPPAPRKNPDLVGHEWAERQFLDAWASGRLPHSWMITGPKGIGKATLAFRIARFVLAGGGQAGGGLFDSFESAAPKSLHVAPEHAVFRRTAAGGHADLMTLERTVDPKTDRMRKVIVIEDVRATNRFLNLTPAEGGWRVLVVDCADELNISSANALLKLLEEPPPRALLLLVSHAPGRLLATVRSRCCRIALKPLDEQQVLGLMARYAPEIADGDDGDAQALARLAEGSIGRALALADEGGLELYREMVSLLAALPALEGAGLHDFADRLARRGAEDAFRTATDLVRWWLAHMIRDGARGGNWGPGVVPEEEGCAGRLFAAAGVDRWMEVWDKVSRLTDQVEGLNLDRKQVVINLFTTMAGAVRA